MLTAAILILQMTPSTCHKALMIGDFEPKMEHETYNYVVQDINKILHEKLQTGVISICHHIM